MKRLARAGMRRLTCSGTMAIVAVIAHSAVAPAQATTKVSAAPQRDTVKRPTGMIILREFSPRIDSIVRALDQLPIGSPEYARMMDSLNTAMRAHLPPGASFGMDAEVTVRMGAPSSPQGTRAVTGFMIQDATPKGWMGMRADGASRKWSSPLGSYIQYFEYPTVVDVTPSSPAARAGVRFGDTLVAYNGLDLRRSAINLTNLLEPGRKVNVRYRRDGDISEITIGVEKAPPSVESERRADAVAETMVASRTPVMIRDHVERQLVEAQAGAAGGGMVTTKTMSPTIRGGVMATSARSGVMGAQMTDVDADFAKSIVGMEGKSGVFISFVARPSPAERAGLKPADVILQVEGAEVASVSLLRVKLQQLELNGAEKVRLTILRHGKKQDLTYETPR